MSKQMNAPSFICFFCQTPKRNIAGSPAYCIRKAKLKTGLATPARKSESVARVESLSRKNNWRANHPLRGRQRVASFSCSKSEYRPCFRGVKGESRVFTRERQPQSSSGVRDRPVLGDKRVGVVALRYNGRPKTVGVWLIT